jgi:hypothetical protein
MPHEAMEWADLADLTYVVADLSERLAKEPLIAKDIEEYLQPLDTADIAKLYDRFIPNWSRALSTHLICRETRSEIDAVIPRNIFDRKLGEGETGVEFHRQVAARFHSKIAEYEANETRLINRAKIVSSFLRDAAAWQSGQTHSRLAQANNQLAQVQNALAHTNNHLTNAGNELSQSTNAAIGLIKGAVESTDRLTSKVARLTWALIILTVPIVILTLIGTIGTWMTDKTREEFQVYFDKVGRQILPHFGRANSNTETPVEPDGK